MSRPRIRSIKPEANQDEAVGRLSRDARLLFFTGLMTMADDEGRLRAMPTLILGHVFPYDEDVTPAKLRRWLDELERERMIVRYEADGTPYIAIRHFRRHQRIDKPTDSTLPAPPDPEIVAANSTTRPGTFAESSKNSPRTVVEDSCASRARDGSDRIGSGEEPPQPPEQARGEHGHEQEASPEKARRSRAAGTSPRKLAAAAAERETQERATAAAAALQPPGAEQHEAWDRVRDHLKAAVNESAWAIHLEPARLAGAAGGTLVVDAPDGSWVFSRFARLIERCGEAVGVPVRVASSSEHAGLRERVAA